MPAVLLELTLSLVVLVVHIVLDLGSPQTDHEAPSRYALSWSGGLLQAR